MTTTCFCFLHMIKSNQSNQITTRAYSLPTNYLIIT